MDSYLPELFLNTLVVGTIVSIIIMTLIQKLKEMEMVKKSFHIFIVNIVCSFGMGIPFAMTFYNYLFKEAIWVSVVSFVGAPTIYEMLKNQKIINYKPSSLNNSIVVPLENEIVRE